MCPNSHSEGLVRGRGTRWRPLVSPAGSTLISFSAAPHSSALAFPLLALGLFLHGSCCLHCMGSWDGGALVSVQWSLQSHGCAPREQDRDTVPPERDTATMPPRGSRLVTSPPLPATFPVLQPHDCPAPPEMATQGSWGGHQGLAEGWESVLFIGVALGSWLRSEHLLPPILPCHPLQSVGSAPKPSHTQP